MSPTQQLGEQSCNLLFSLIAGEKGLQKYHRGYTNIVSRLTGIKKLGHNNAPVHFRMRNSHRYLHNGVCRFSPSFLLVAIP
uniref:Transcriptional regulator YcjW, LacI family n=1 Tax=Klebsiella pneumoniae TaxID=573 RepID=A0A8B0SVL7_KLEPN|nr:Transcriptional regulator YcjW, LacI family [Klebsiella pneumoniae]